MSDMGVGLEHLYSIELNSISISIRENEIIACKVIGTNTFHFHIKISSSQFTIPCLLE